jgi:Thioredoxin.
MVTELLNNTIKKDVAAFEVNEPTVIYYMMTGCGFCEQFKPQWKKFKQEALKLYPKLQIMKANVSKSQKSRILANKLDITSFPTVVFFINGNMHRYIGSNTTSEDLMKGLKELLK